MFVWQKLVPPSVPKTFSSVCSEKDSVYHVQVLETAYIIQSYKLDG